MEVSLPLHDLVVLAFAIYFAGGLTGLLMSGGGD